MKTMGIDYGDSRVGIALTDSLGITAQWLETIHHNGNDKIVLKRLEEIINEKEVDTIAIGMPYKLNGDEADRVEITKKFIQKLKCKFNKVKIETVDERLTTVAAHKTMNFLDVKNKNKRSIVDTLSAVYILEMYMNKNK